MYVQLYNNREAVGIFFQMFQTCLEVGIIYYSYLLPFLSSISLYISVILLSLITSFIKVLSIILTNQYSETFPTSPLSSRYYFFPAPGNVISFAVIFAIYLTLFLFNLVFHRFKTAPNTCTTFFRVFRGSTDVLLYLFYIVLIQFINIISGLTSIITYTTTPQDGSFQRNIQRVCDCAIAVNLLVYTITFIPIFYVTCLLVSKRYYTQGANFYFDVSRSSTINDDERFSYDEDKETYDGSFRGSRRRDSRDSRDGSSKGGSSPKKTYKPTKSKLHREQSGLNREGSMGNSSPVGF